MIPFKEALRNAQSRYITRKTLERSHRTEDTVSALAKYEKEVAQNLVKEEIGNQREVEGLEQ